MASLFDKLRKRKVGFAKPQSRQSPRQSGLKGLASRRSGNAVPEDRSVSGYAEISRICNMDIVSDLTETEIDEMSREILLASEYHDRGTRLYHTQANSIRKYEISRGGFFPVGVGWGKTLISLVIANKAFNRERDPVKRIILLIPPDVVEQLVKEDLPEWRQKAKIQFPVHLIAGRSKKARMALASRRKAGVYIMAYSQLSFADTDDLLDTIDAGLYILDEAHNLLDTKSARSNRMYKRLALARPELVAMSGTMTNKSLLEYYKLATYSLRQNNFMPNAFPLASEWAKYMDAEATKHGDIAVTKASINSVAPLVRWANDKLGMELSMTPTGFRKAYQARAACSPGCYSSGDAKIDCRLTISQIRIDRKYLETYKGWNDLMKLKEQVVEGGKTPNGDVIEHPFHEYKWLSEICGCGFYNELKWPNAKKLAKQRGVSVLDAENMLSRSMAHHDARNIYAKTLREYLKRRAKKGLDTPMLVGREFYAHGIKNLPREEFLYGQWKDMKALEFEGMPEREPRAVYVCDFKIQEALQWAVNLPEGEGAIIWYVHVGVGRWMFSALNQCDLDAIHCPAGPRHNVAIKDRANEKKIVVASIGGHGTGKNLQRFKHQLFLEWPRPAKTAEQTLGRLHRNGQKAPRIVANILVCDEWDDLNFAATLNDALYIHQTMGNRQKLIYADYDPTPKIFPEHVLKERGAENVAHLSQDNIRVLKDKFGEFSKVQQQTQSL